LEKITELLNEFEQARQKIRRQLDGIDIHMEIYPNWTVKELLAHLAGWDDATIVALQAHSQGETTPQLALRGIDAYNVQTVGERAGLGYEQIVLEWELVREQLVAILQKLPLEQLSDRIVSPWGPMLSVEELICIMIEHEEEHADVLEERRKASGK
jgi:hypothetical protein